MVARWRDLASEVKKDPDLFIDEHARRRLGAFTRRMFANYEPAAHITALIEALERVVATPGGRLIVTMPPRHSKSLHVSEHLPAWYLGRNPDKRIIAASHSAHLAYTFSRRVRNKIAHPDYPFPGVKVADDKGAVQGWDIEGHQGGYMAVGVGGSPTGHGGNIVIDDPIRSAADAESQTIRDGLWEWYQSTIRPRLEPADGWIVVTATRWHADDLTGRLLAAQATGGEHWEHLHLPAISDAGEALWPDRWSLEALREIKGAVGSRAWEAQYQGRPSPAEGGIFKRHWWRFWHAPGLPLPPVSVRNEKGESVLCPCLPLPPWFDDQVQSWDMAFKANAGNSYVVGQVWGALRGDAYLLTQTRDHLDFPQSVAAVRGLSAAWPRAATKLIEDKANGPAVIATLRHEIPGIVPVEPGGSKEARAHAFSPAAESGNLYLPHPAIAPWVNDFIEEAAGFPFGTTDQVDAAGQAITRLLFSGRGGITQSNYLEQGRDDDEHDGYWGAR